MISQTDLYRRALETKPACQHGQQPAPKRENGGRDCCAWDTVDESSWESFPASDPPSFTP